MNILDISVSIHPASSRSLGLTYHEPLTACDGMTNSEIVVPLLNKIGQVVGVLDLDSTLKGTFTEEDRIGLERIARHLAI